MYVIGYNLQYVKERTFAFFFYGRSGLLAAGLIIQEVA